jgi:AraC-like DNA-binding protein
LLHWAAFSQALFLSVYFLRSRPGFRLQALLLFVIALGVLQGSLYTSHQILNFPHMARTGFALMAMIGPLVLLSTLTIHKERITRPERILPFLVPAGIVIYLSPFYLSSAAEKLSYLHEDLVQIHFDCLVILYAALANNLLSLLYLMARLVRQKAFRLNRILFYGGLLLVLMIPFALSVVDQNLLNSGLFTSVVSVLVLLRSWQIVFRAESGRIASFLYEAIPEKYQKSRVAPEQMTEIAARMEQQLQTKPYLDPDYSLTDLAQSLGVSPHALSQVFSQRLRQNFSAFIAERRLAEAKRMLRDTAFREFSVLRIGFEAGFNSKSSFYELFRRETGQTPAEFRTNQRIEGQPGT